ncbi:MAG: hypothetical protein AAF630_05945 [Cyanobacteria bacterium P01_C01_bin.38]
MGQTSRYDGALRCSRQHTLQLTHRNIGMMVRCAARDNTPYS